MLAASCLACVVVVLGSRAPPFAQDAGWVEEISGFCVEDEICVPDTFRVLPDLRSFVPEVGATFDVWIALDTETDGIQSWTYGVAHDGDTLTLEPEFPTTDGTDLTRLLGERHFVSTTALGQAGFVQAVILSFDQPYYLPISSRHTFARVRYRLRDTSADSTLVSFTDSLAMPGSPPVEVLFSIDGRTGRPREVASARILLADAPPARFIRGDVDRDTRLTITDAIAVLHQLLDLAPLRSPCREASDVDNDGRITVTDAIRVLLHLFQGGAPPPAPFPDCGEDTDDDGLECPRGFEACG